MKVKLKDIGKIVTGKTPSKREASYWDSDDIPFVKPDEFKNDVSILTSYNSYVSTSGSAKGNKVPANSVLVTCIGTIGKVVVTEKEVITNQQINAIIPNEKIDSKYLMYQILKKREYLNHIANAPVVPIVNKSTFEKVEIFLLPLTEQKTIAKTLDKAKELIELRKASIEKLDELSKSVFIDMFGDPMENPMGWEVVKLSNYGVLARGKSSHRPRNAPELYDGSYPFIQTGDVSNGNNIYLSEYKQTYSELGIQQSKLFKKGVVAIAIAANIGNAKILNLDCYFPDSVVGFSTSCPEFTLFLLGFYRDILDSRATKTAQKNINLKIRSSI